jgi:Arc/MetJ-type ribon-helix-helix transcriptional regulator
MTIHLSPEDERIICERLASGRFQTAEEVIHHALLADREASAQMPSKRTTTLA